MIKKIDIEELNYIIQDIKDDINSGARVIDCPAIGNILIDINMRGIKFKFIDMLPYIEEVSDRLEDMDIKMVDITIRFTDEEPLKITDLEFYDIINNKSRLNNILHNIDLNDNLSNISIRYEYEYGDSKNSKKPKQSLIKKFKSYFESNIYDMKFIQTNEEFIGKVKKFFGINPSTLRDYQAHFDTIIFDGEKKSLTGTCKKCKVRDDIQKHICKKDLSSEKSNWSN